MADGDEEELRSRFVVVPLLLAFFVRFLVCFSLGFNNLSRSGFTVLFLTRFLRNGSHTRTGHRG